MLVYFGAFKPLQNIRTLVYSGVSEAKDNFSLSLFPFPVLLEYIASYLFVYFCSLESRVFIQN